MRAVFFSIFASALAGVGCGGNVVVDGTAKGTGASGGAAATTSSSSSASTGGSGGGSGACPLVSPQQGATCDTNGLSCNLYDCCGGTATCSFGEWSLTPGQCAQPCANMCPGTLDGCADDAACVESGADGNPDPSYACGPNPCGAAALDCSCAAALCGQAPCLGVANGILQCGSIGI